MEKGGGYGFEDDVDSIKQLETAKRQAKKVIDTYKKDTAPEAKEVMYKKTKENIENADENYMSKVIEIVKNEEEQNDFNMAVGDVVIDLEKMIENAKKRKGDNNE